MPEEVAPETQVPVLTHRPVQIALHPIKGAEDAFWGIQKWHSLQHLAEVLNARQRVFQYTAEVELTPDGLLTEKHGYSKIGYYNCLADQIAHTSYDAAIGITHWDLEESQFNQHCELRRVGVVTTSAFEAYLPSGGSLLKYLIYLILCESFCLTTALELEHKERNFCLFDACTLKDDLVRCLRRPQIEDDCVRRLDSLGFAASELEEIADVLDYIGGTSWLHFAGEAVYTPGAGFLLGVAVAFGGAILATVSLMAAIVVLGVVTVCWLGIVTSRHSYAEWRRRHKWPTSRPGGGRRPRRWRRKK